MSEVISRDGTRIAYEARGAGPAVILVDGALCSRGFGPTPKLVPLLAPHFTVYAYDRRGRGQSGDTAPYAREREVDDLAALIEAAGGSAALVGFSSGAALALEAAASGLRVRKVAAYEPPYIAAKGAAPPPHEARLREFIAAGRRSEAVQYFMRDMVAVPAPAVIFMRLMRWVWKKLEAVAHTLPYDAAVMGDFVVPRARLAAIGVPTLAMNGSKTTPALKSAARAVAEAVPGAQHRVLEGQDHNASPQALTPVLVEFLRD
jgi:pimeloyl-ACP methyl ester carboxylesterase